MDRHAYRRTVHRARKALVRSGVTARVQAVRDALRAAAFASRFEADRALREMADPLTDMESVRGLVIGVLDQLGVDHRDVLIQFTWDPGARALSIFATESPAAAAAALAIVRGEAPRGKRPSIAAGAHAEC